MSPVAGQGRGRWLKLALVPCVAVHGWLTLRSWQSHGYAGFFPPFRDANTRQIFSDLVIALTLVNLAIAYDLWRRKKSLLWSAVVVVATAITGSFAPLAYLALRPFGNGNAPRGKLQP